LGHVGRSVGGDTTGVSICFNPSSSSLSSSSPVLPKIGTNIDGRLVVGFTVGFIVGDDVAVNKKFRFVGDNVVGLLVVGFTVGFIVGTALLDVSDGEALGELDGQGTPACPKNTLLLSRPSIPLVTR
jgi:hypothetical protein